MSPKNNTNSPLKFVFTKLKESLEHPTYFVKNMWKSVSIIIILAPPCLSSEHRISIRWLLTNNMVPQTPLNQTSPHPVRFINLHSTTDRLIILAPALRILIFLCFSPSLLSSMKLFPFPKRKKKKQLLMEAANDTSSSPLINCSWY